MIVLRHRPVDLRRACRRTLPLLVALVAAGVTGACGSKDSDLSGAAGMPGLMRIQGVTRDRPMGGDAGAPRGGAPVKLMKASKEDGACDSPVANTVSDADGTYSFEAEAGRYCVGTDEASLSEPFTLDSSTGDKTQDVIVP